MITNKNYNVHFGSLEDKKLMYDFAKEMHFDVRGLSRKYTRDNTPIKLLKSPSLLVSASGVWKTIILSSDTENFWNTFKLLLQEKQASSKSDRTIVENIALVDKLLEYKCISKKQHKQLSIKCNLLHEQV